MRTIRRLIFFGYTLILTLLSLGVILLYLRLIPIESVWKTLYLIWGNLEIGLTGVIFLGVGLWALLGEFFKKKENKFITQYNLLGNVNISLRAIECMIEKVAKNMNGIKDVKVNVFLTSPKAGNGISAVIKTVISHEINIPLLTGDMQKRIQEHVKNTVGIELDELKIVVEAVSNDFKIKSRVQ